jgi:hypothetical protein
MAKFIPLLGTLSGSIAGTTWGHNKGGPIARARRVPTNPQRSRQQIARSFLIQGSVRWSNTLDDTERSQWTDWASTNPVINTLGQSTLLTGHQAFSGQTALARLCNRGLPLLPPTHTAPVTPTLDTVVVDASAQTIAFNRGVALATGEDLIVFMSLPTHVGRVPSPGTFRFQQRQVNPGATPSFSLRTHVQTGQRVAGRIFTLSVDLLLSVPFAFDVIVVA